MAEIDTSSYPKPAAMPVQKSMIEQMGQYQNLERGNVALSAEKLSLINDQFKLMNNELANLAATPGMSKEQAAQNLNRFANTYKFPPEVTQHMITELNSAPDVKSFAENAIRRGLDTNSKINQMYGTPTSVNDNSNIQAGVQRSSMQGGGFNPATTMPVQLAPNQPLVNNNRLLPNGQPNPNYLQPTIVGPSGPPGVVPVNPPSAVPLPRPAPQMPIAAAPAPAAAPPVSGATGPTVNNGTEFNNRFATGAPPGVAAAIASVAGKSGEDYATDLRRLNTYQADIQPDLAVLNIVKGKTNADFGPGTEALNNLKKLATTWLPNVDPKVINDATEYDTVKKYLVQGARTSGNTGTNDQLAAAFDANPNVTMNTATIESIVKSRLALKKMQAAQTLLFGQQNLPEDQYSKWVAKNQNVLDPRAFGFDMMDDTARAKLLESMATKDKSGNWVAKKGKEKEFNRFENSLSFANDAGFIEPPGRR